MALLGLLGDEVVGVASYQLTADAAAAELALAVADGMHRHGIATLLLEHLVSLARARGVKVLVADVLPDNYAVLRVLSDAGLAVRRKFADGVVEVSMPVPRNAALGEASTWLDAVAGRDKHADVASLESLLAPRSAAVVGGAAAWIGRPHDPAQYPRRRFRRAACTRSARTAATSRASRASRRSPSCPRPPIWPWWRYQRRASWRWPRSAGGAASGHWW